MLNTVLKTYLAFSDTKLKISIEVFHKKIELETVSLHCTIFTTIYIFILRIKTTV